MANIMQRNNGHGGMSTTAPRSFGGLVDSVLQNTLNEFFNDDFPAFNGTRTRTQVPVNIRETDATYEMEVVAPGLRKEDISVNIGDNMLTVSFEHKNENKHENKKDGYLLHEYRMQSFTRSFTLDDTVDADKITAEYRNGVLYVSMPKKEGAKRITKNITVQ